MDNAEVTEAEELFDAIYGNVSRYAEWGIPEYREAALRTINDTLERHRLERSEPVGCQYPVHGSVTHVRNVECCDFCGHPADTTPPEPVAEIERLREGVAGDQWLSNGTQRPL